MSTTTTTTVQTNAAGAWTEPPWCGWIETTGDALLILEAARRGIIPRVTRRLVDSERKMITSGSVFVFDEDESGIKRWTDGFFWSPSRILGNFLLYRETDKRGAGHRGLRTDTQDYNAASSQYNVDGVKVEDQSLSRPKGEGGRMGSDKHRERSLVGSLTNSYKFKTDGLMKKTFSLTIAGVSQHLISYYKVEDVEQGRLRSPSSIPELAALDISPEYLDKTHFRNPPKVEIGIDGIPRYRGEADEIDLSPRLYPPLSTGVPLLTDGRLPSPGSEGSTGHAKRNGKRYDPYGTGTGSSRRSRKSKSNNSPTSPTGESSQSPVSPTSAYPDSGMSAPPYTSYSLPPYGGYYPSSSGYGGSPPHGPMFPPPNTYSVPAINTSGLASPGPTSPHSQQSSPSPTPQAMYGPYSPHSVDSQPGSGGQYPPLYPPYGQYSANYQGVTWPPYSAYPPQLAGSSAASGDSASGGRIEEADNDD